MGDRVGVWLGQVGYVRPVTKDELLERVLHIPTKKEELFGSKLRSCVKVEVAVLGSRL